MIWKILYIAALAGLAAALQRTRTRVARVEARDRAIIRSLVRRSPAKVTYDDCPTVTRLSAHRAQRSDGWLR